MLYPREIKKALYFVERPNHIGVCTGVGDAAGFYLISAEYSDGYLVLGSYKRLANAEAALPKIKSKLGVEQ